MTLLGKLFQNITADDLTNLITNQVSERKVIDYKVALPGNSDDHKREFLADVSSFANASGGIILYGVEEVEGIATNLPGVSPDDKDAEILRLENILRDGLQPRIAGIETKYLQLDNGNYAFLINIPTSWIGPHMVTFKNLSRFFSRNSAGKYQLDVQELRQAFNLSEDLNQRIRNFRADRLAKIIAGETPFSLSGGARWIMHSVPINAFLTKKELDMRTSGYNFPNVFDGRFQKFIRFNLEGLVSAIYDVQKPISYVQLFRNGIIEVVDTLLLSQEENDQPFIRIIRFEKWVINTVTNILQYQKMLGNDNTIAN